MTKKPTPDNPPGFESVTKPPHQSGWYRVLFQDLEMWAQYSVIPTPYGRHWSLPDPHVTHWQVGEPLPCRPFDLPEVA